MNKVKVIINEEHQILKEQEDILNGRFGKNSWERINVPKNGWKISQIEEVVRDMKDERVVIISPIPLLILRLVKNSTVYVFHNDVREKKELPNGKIIMTIASTGWELLN